MASEAVVSLAGARVLVAEDSAVAATLTRDALVAAGCSVRVERDGEAALAALDEERFDVLVTDWLMPRMNGLELCAAVRGRDDLADLYVVFLTQLGDTRQVVEALAAGGDDYVHKPFDPGELIARVRAGYRLVRSQRELRSANETLARLAMTDPLTELPNRRALERLLDGELAAFARSGAPFCLARVDVDRFKHVNDTYGHAAGDDLLVTVARALRRATRAGDVVSRIGGDEFDLIVRGSLDGATAACERALGELRAAGARSGRAVSASIGVAAARPGLTRDALAAEADAALYAAKRAGGDRVVVAADPPTPSGPRLLETRQSVHQS